MNDNRITFDPYALSERQLDGLACVVCGDAFAAGSLPVPAGEALGAQVLACAPCAGENLRDVIDDLSRVIDALEGAIASGDPRRLDQAVTQAEPVVRQARGLVAE